MLGRLVKQFVKRGARDHLSARRVQEEADLHRLFVLTAFQRAEGDGPELVQRVVAEGKDLQFDELKAEVTSNLTEQAHRACAAVRDALAEAHRGQGAGTSRASPSARSLSEGVLRRLGFAPRVAPSGAGPDAGDGLFVRGEVNPGEIVAWYPGLVYDLESVRHIPGYPKVAERNPYLAARYDGSVVDAKPWGSGGAAVDVDMDARIGVRSSTAREDDEDDQTRFGSWPGPPLEENDSAPSSEETSPETTKKKRSGVGGFLDAQLAPELDPGLRSEARAAALGVQRDNPLALAHFANHPPKGYRPNVVVAGVDVVFRGDQVASLRAFMPYAALGRWPFPPSRERVFAAAAARAKRGWFASRLHDMFGEEDEGEDHLPPRSRFVSGRRRRRSAFGGGAGARARRVGGAQRRGGVFELQAEHARGAPGVVPPRGRGGGQEALGERLGVLLVVVDVRLRRTKARRRGASRDGFRL
jgi:hypothetical protein